MYFHFWFHFFSFLLSLQINLIIWRSVFRYKKILILGSSKKVERQSHPSFFPKSINILENSFQTSPQFSNFSSILNFLPTMNHDILSGSHEFTKLLYCMRSQPWENIELVLMSMTLTYGWDPKVRWLYIS